MTTAGITKLYDRFADHLESRKEFVAPLQLTGRLEEYLVREFIGYAYRASGHKLLGLSNLGKKKEPRIDIAFIQGKAPESPTIVGLVEAKYLRNAHRYEETDSARDEVWTTLKDFQLQVHAFEGAKQRHAGIPVHLSSRNHEVYGLVFVSYTKPIGQYRDENKRKFHSFVLRKAREADFRYYDLKTPRLDSVYENEPVEALGTEYKVSLRIGLWRAGHP